LSPRDINLTVSPSNRRRRNSTAAAASLTPRSSGFDADVAFKDAHKSAFSNVLSSIGEIGVKGASDAINAISAAISAMSPKSTMAAASNTPVISRSSATRRHSRPGSPREAVSDVTETSEPIVAPPSSGIMAALTRQLSQAALFSAMKSKKVADEVPLPDSPTAFLSPKMMTNGGGGMLSPKGGVAASQARRATMAAPVPDLTIIGSPAPINKGAPPKTASKAPSSVLKPTVSSAMKARNPREKIPLFSPVAI
jgi:hypothetical protein